MNSKRLMLAVPVILGLMLSVPAVFATVTPLSVSPSSIPTDGTVTISLCTTATWVVQQVHVTTPDGIVWKHVGPDVQLSPNYICPTTFNLVFGDNSPDWCVASLTPILGNAGPCLDPQPSASQTGVSGAYTVQVIWKSTPRSTEQFHVFDHFEVPEFGLPGVVTAAMGLVTVALLTRYKLRRVP